MFLMLARKPKMMKSLASLGIHRPILKAIEIAKGRGTDWRGHGGGFGFLCDDLQNTSISDGQGMSQGMFMYFCLFLL